MSVLLWSGGCSSDCSAGSSLEFEGKGRDGAFCPDQLSAVKSPSTDYSATVIEEEVAFGPSLPVVETTGESQPQGHVTC